MLKKESQPMYRYKIFSTESSSRDYGICDVCGKHVSEVFNQQEERFYQHTDENGDIEKEGWTTYKCTSLWGHKECLISERR
jgi:DNA-directed RNA polymerase subunit N (RpoN/RPB10)